MKTDWNNSAQWYSKHLQGKDTFQTTLIFPETIRLLQAKAGKHYLDIACGEGSFAGQLSQRAKAFVTGFDLAPRLIAQANKRHLRNCRFGVGDALHFPEELMQEQFDGATCILAIQNIEDYQKVFDQTATLLKPRSNFVMVLNHPTFRPPKQSGWGIDDQRKLQYRRIDTYLTPYHVALAVHPGRQRSGKQPSTERSEQTVSFHHPLQDYITGLVTAGFVITAIEEWVSNRSSLPGKNAKMENRARQEFPLFMAIRAEKRS